MICNLIIRDLTTYSRKYEPDFRFNFNSNDDRLIGILDSDEASSSFILRAMAGLNAGSTGSISLKMDKTSVSLFEEKKYSGFIFSSGGLLSNLSVLENFLLPFNFHFPDVSENEKIEKIEAMLNLFDLSREVLYERPANLSYSVGKIIQICRIYVLEPSLIFYEQPFMHLDLKHQNKLFNLISEYKKKEILQIFTTNFYPALLREADRLLLFSKREYIEEGEWTSISKNPSEKTIEIVESFKENGNEN